MVGQPGAKYSLRRAKAHRDQQILGPQNLPGFGRIRAMNQKLEMSKDALIIMNLSGRGDKDVAQVADKVKLQKIGRASCRERV